MIRSVTILTGAGISAESGIPTFRASDGLWENHPVEQVATPEGFARDPELVHRFYNARRARAASAEPNAGHVALADFERAFTGEFLLVTQNIDDLHERAGSRNILHMHGTLNQMHCTNCAHVWDNYGDTAPADPCPNCAEPQTRPDIVWFGEMPYEMERIWTALDRTDLFLSIGTSGNVYPAAGFAQYANRKGAECIEFNLEPTIGQHDFHDGIYGLASKTLGPFLEQILNNEVRK